MEQPLFALCLLLQHFQLPLKNPQLHILVAAMEVAHHLAEPDAKLVELLLLTIGQLQPARLSQHFQHIVAPQVVLDAK